MTRIPPIARGALVLSAVFLAACPGDSTKPKVPTDLLISTGNGQLAVAGKALSTPPKVKVVSDDGSGVGAITVTWTVGTGGGSLSSTTSTTDAEGIATAGTWTLGATAGGNTLLATATGVAKTVTFLATGTAGEPASVTVQSGANQVTAAGAPVTTLPSVKVVDANANVVSGAMVTFAVASGGGSITGANATTNSSGIATVGSWILGSTVGTQSLSAAVVGLPAVTISVTATSPPTKLVINMQPAGAVSGEPLGTQPVVSIRDASNNLVTNSTAVVTASIGSGTGTLGGTTSIAAVNGVATFTNLVVTGTSAVSLNFVSSGLTGATSTTFTPSPPAELNLTIDGVHLNQGSQTYTGAVPIVAGRPALARVFVKANKTNSSTPAVRLRTFTNGTLFKTYTITAPTTFVPTEIDDGVLNWSWNVLIPADEVVTGMTVSADVDPANAIAEGSETDNSFPLSGTPLALDVRQVSTMKVTFVPIKQPTPVVGNITESNKIAVLDYAKRVYPFDTVDVQIHAVYNYGTDLNGQSYDSGWSTLLSNIAAMRTAEGVTDRYYYGVAHPAYNSGGTGLGQVGGPNAIGMDFTGLVNPSTNYYNMTIAHEWGHNFGRRHVNCGGPANADLNYPHDAATSIGVHGYDNAYGVLRRATDFKEFMSYCQPLWISDYTYKAVLDWRQTRFEPPPAAGTQKALLVWGRIGTSGAVLEPAYEIDVPAALPSRPGPYTIEVLDDAGRRLTTVPFDGFEIDHMPGERTFAYAIPLPTFSSPTTIRLTSGTRELARRSRSMSLGANAANTNMTSASRLISMGGARARLEWDARTYPGAMVRDPATGQVLAFLTGGAGEVAASGPVDVLFSNGVSSVRQRMTISPR